MRVTFPPSLPSHNGLCVNFVYDDGTTAPPSPSSVFDNYVRANKIIPTPSNRILLIAPEGDGLAAIRVGSSMDCRAASAYTLLTTTFTRMRYSHVPSSILPNCSHVVHQKTFERTRNRIELRSQQEGKTIRQRFIRLFPAHNGSSMKDTGYGLRLE